MTIPKFIKTKKFWFFLVLAAVVLFFVFRSNGTNPADIQTDTVKKQDLKQTVLATGQVVSQTDLALSFKTSGVVQRVNTKVGDKVKAGQVLAYIDQADEAARLTQARGALKQAEANYQKVVDGSSNEQIEVAKVALNNAKVTLENTKKQQKVAVDNAYKALLNSSLQAIPESSNLNNITLPVTGTYNSTQEGIYTIVQEGKSFYVKGLEVAGNQNFNSSVSTPLPVGSRGLYIEFPSSTQFSNDRWTISIPNTQASNYVTNYNAYQTALQTQATSIDTAESAVATAQANLDLQMAQARPADLSAAEAQVLSAKGQVEAAYAALENTIIRAPADGTITKVDAKVGQQANASQSLIILQDVTSLHIESNVSEANIVSIKPEQSVEITFDALGPDRKFTGKVSQIDPASTVVSGVINYKITVNIEQSEEIKPGMTANIIVLTDQRTNVISVPSRAVVSVDGKKVVRVVEDTKNKTYKEVNVTTGLEADGGMVEVLSGLNEGQEIVTFIKTK